MLYGTEQAGKWVNCTLDLKQEEHACSMTDGKANSSDIAPLMHAQTFGTLSFTMPQDAYLKDRGPC